jgi:hypothetical protein
MWDTQTHRQQGDLISLLTKIWRITERHGQQGELIKLLMRIRGLYTDTDVYTDREQGDLITYTISSGKN